MKQADADGAGVRFPPPIIYAAGLGIGLLASRVWNLPGVGIPAWPREILGGLILAAGLAVSAAGVGSFVTRRTAIIPYKPASTLVTTGIYRWTRNPMYLGLAMVYAGLAVLTNSLAALVLLVFVVTIIQLKVIAREEQYLERAFGATYIAYRRNVRRWI